MPLHHAHYNYPKRTHLQTKPRKSGKKTISTSCGSTSSPRTTSTTSRPCAPSTTPTTSRDTRATSTRERSTTRTTVLPPSPAWVTCPPVPSSALPSSSSPLLAASLSLH